VVMHDLQRVHPRVICDRVQLISVGGTWVNVMMLYFSRSTSDCMDPLDTWGQLPEGWLGLSEDVILHLRAPCNIGWPLPGSNKAELGLNPDKKAQTRSGGMWCRQSSDMPVVGSKSKKAQAGWGSWERKPQDSELNKLIPFRQIRGSKTYANRTRENIGGLGLLLIWLGGIPAGVHNEELNIDWPYNYRVDKGRQMRL